MLCEPCREAGRVRTRRLLAFDEMWDALHRAQRSIADVSSEYPEAAPLVEQVHQALAAAFPALDAMRRQLHGPDRAIATRMDAARQ